MKSPFLRRRSRLVLESKLDAFRWELAGEPTAEVESLRVILKSTLDILQGYWQMPLAEEAQGMLHETAFSQSTMSEVSQRI